MMGFNKRYLTESGLKNVFFTGSYGDLVNYIRKPDALFIRDEFSEKIYNILKDETLKEKDKYIKVTNLMEK